MDCTNLYDSYALTATLTSMIDIPGFLLNGFSVLCILKILRKQSESTGNMFKYLFVKSISEFLLFAIDILYLVYDCKSCGMANSLAGEIWNLYFATYTEICLMYVSSLMEVIMTLDCYLSITKRWKFLLKEKMFYVIISSAIAFSVLYHTYYIFGRIVAEVDISRSMNETSVNGTTAFFVEYKIAKTSFGKSRVFKFLSSFRTILRDIALLIVTIVLNTLILIEMRSVTLAKRRLILNSSTPSHATDESDTSVVKAPPQSHLVSTAVQAERKRCIMVLVTGLVYGFGHVGQAVVNLQGNFFTHGSTVWLCLQFLATHLLKTSYAISFFSYYFFNNQFKKYANQYIRCVFSFLAGRFRYINIYFFIFFHCMNKSLSCYLSPIC
jgi:hypothetical protein